MRRDGELELITLLFFYFLTGARRNEIFNLEAGDIKEDIGFIHVRKSKTKKERWVPIPPQLYEVIEEFNLPTKGKIFTRYRHPDTVTHKIKRYLVKAGFKEFRLHDLRHTFASLLSMSGASQKDLKELLGHRDIRKTDRYTHLSRKYLQEVFSGHGIAINQKIRISKRLKSGGKVRWRLFITNQLLYR